MRVSAKILFYADDSDDDRDLLREALIRSGLVWPLVMVNDGWEAIAHLNERLLTDRANLPSLILLDKKMPKADGMDVLRWIRERDAFSSVPVVMLSTSDLPQEIDTARALGADAYFQKGSRTVTTEQLRVLHEISIRGRSA